MHRKHRPCEGNVQYFLSSTKSLLLVIRFQQTEITKSKNLTLGIVNHLSSVHTGVTAFVYTAELYPKYNGFNYWQVNFCKNKNKKKRQKNKQTLMAPPTESHTTDELSVTSEQLAL